MNSKKRMPPLTMDEVLLLVDTYYRVGEVDLKLIHTSPELFEIKMLSN